MVDVPDKIGSRPEHEQIVIDAALEVANRNYSSIEEWEAVHNKLYHALSEIDPFWVRWMAAAERRGVNV